MARVSVGIDIAGLRQLCLSDAMHQAVLDQAEKLADAANEHAYAHQEEMSIRGHKFENPPYKAVAKGGRRTAIGFASTATYVGYLNEAVNKSLMSQLHGQGGQ